MKDLLNNYLVIVVLYVYSQCNKMIIWSYSCLIGAVNRLYDNIVVELVQSQCYRVVKRLCGVILDI